MVIPGRVENGVVVLPAGTALPEGAEVMVSLCARANEERATMSPEHQQRYLAALARIDAIHNENPSDDFRGADHDRVPGLRGSCPTIRITRASQRGLRLTTSRW
jgi:hypothetical protein